MSDTPASHAMPPDDAPAWYGSERETSVADEYRAAREGAGLGALPERALLAVTGAPARKFIHGLVSNDVQSCGEGHGCQAALMDVKGHLLALFRVLVSSDAVRLELPRERLPLVQSTLEHYRVAAPVRFTLEPQLSFALLGPRADDVLARAGVLTPGAQLEAHRTTLLAGVEVRVVRAGDLPGPGFVLHVPPASAAASWQALLEAGARPLGRHALDALRVECGRPWYGYDVDESNLLHETGLLREVHSSTKGCYVGQEVVARLEARGGHVNKALRGLRLTSPARPGTPLCVGDDVVGRVTTCAVSPRLGPIALAYVHRNSFEPETAVSVDGHPARISALPFDDEPRGMEPQTC